MTTLETLEQKEWLASYLKFLESGQNREYVKHLEYINENYCVNLCNGEYCSSDVLKSLEAWNAIINRPEVFLTPQEEALNLLIQRPKVIKALPTMLGLHEEKYQVWDVSKRTVKTFDFSTNRIWSTYELVGIINLLENVGLFEAIKSKEIDDFTQGHEVVSRYSTFLY